MTGERYFFAEKFYETDFKKITLEHPWVHENLT